MSKKIDWQSMYKAPGRYNPDGSKRMTMKESFAKAHAKQEAIQKQQENLNQLMPLLKKSLLDHIVNRKPLKVTRTFNNVVEKVEKTMSGVRYVQGGEKVEAGQEIVFDHLDEMMGQFIFKSKTTGQEYAIYTSPKIAIGDGMRAEQINNPGYYGLLLNTSIYDNLSKLLDGNE